MLNLTKSGVPIENLLDELDSLMDKNRFRIMDDPACRVITTPHELAVLVQSVFNKKVRSPMQSPYQSDEVYKKEFTLFKMLAELYNHPDPDNTGGFTTLSGTDAIKSVISIYLTEYAEKNGFEQFRQKGLFNWPTDMAKPAIIAPVSYNSALRLATETNIGLESIYTYDLDEDFEADPASIEQAIDKIHDDGRKVMLNFIVLGDSELGKVQNADKIIRIVNNNTDYDVRHVGDACAGWYHIFMDGIDGTYWDGSKKFDWEKSPLDAMILDGHKWLTASTASYLVFRDQRDMSIVLRDNNTINTRELSSLKIKEESYRFQLTCRRDASLRISGNTDNILQMYFMLKHFGKDGLITQSRQIKQCVYELGQYIENTDYWNLLAQPQTAIVAFSPQDRIYVNEAMMIINNEYKPAMVRISNSLGARTIEQKGKSPGLFFHFMHHNTHETVSGLIEILENVSSDLSSSNYQMRYA